VKYSIAIDMGSTNTVILKNGVGVVLVEPTLILLDEDGKKNPHIAFGEDAINEFNQIGDNLQLVSPIRNGIIINKDLAKKLLKHFLEKIEEKSYFKGNLLWLLPSSISQNDRNEFINLGYGLGYKNVDVLPSAIAGLEQLEVEHTSNKSHMLVGIGGGLVDVSVVYKGKVVQGCSINIGGGDLDSEIKNYFSDSYNIVLSEQKCKEIKEFLFSILPNDIINYTLHGDVIGDYAYNELNISAQELRSIYTNYCDKVCEAIATVLKMCNNQILKDINKTGIYICGGMANMLGIDKYMRSKLGINVYIDDNPQTSIMFGVEKLFSEPLKLEYLIDLNN
jgi:rod shape-determining protein MreB